MPPNAPEHRAQFSVLDRLLDDDPKRSEDPPVSRANSVRQVKAAVCRDLEWLLNTRCTPEWPGEEQEEVQASVYTYGLPDFSAYAAGSVQAKQMLRRELEKALETFEPRLANVTVTTVDSQEEKDRRVVRFLITGLLRMDPAPEQVSFDTVLELTRGEYRIRED